MLREVKGLHGAVLRAQDGEIGSVDDIRFDDEMWTARYLIVDTGSWLLGRKVLIAPAALGLLDGDRRELRVNLTRAQVEGSPSAETENPCHASGRRVIMTITGCRITGAAWAIPAAWP